MTTRRSLAAGLALLAAACATEDLPGPTRGTWLLGEGVEGRSVTVTDTTVRIEVEAGAFGSATMDFTTTEHRPRGDHERVRFDEVVLERSAGDSLVSRIVLTADSSVFRQPGGRQVFTASDSVLSEGGRLVLAPRADSSLLVGLPSRLLRGGEGGLGALGTVAWPDSAGALEGADGWTVIEYGVYRP